MRVLIDIAHPAHIHYFRNFSKIFENKGHKILFTLRNKGIILELANYYGLNYKIRSSKESSKLWYAISSTLNILRIAWDYKPDIFIDMGTVFAAPVATFMRKPYIAFDDTEVSIKTRFLHMPFTDHILTPQAFEIELNPKKHIKLFGFMELFYLRPSIFQKDSRIFDKLGIKQGEKYVIFRFVSWDAHHDKGLSGISLGNKIKAVKEVEKFAKVFISSEKTLPAELQKYKFNLPSYCMHDAIAFSSLLFGESSTMASEAAMLGVPAIFVDKLGRGYTRMLETKYGLVHNFTEEDQVRAIDKAVELLTCDKNDYERRNMQLLADTINMNEFLVWFIENYPFSAKELLRNQDYQLKFR